MGGKNQGLVPDLGLVRNLSRERRAEGGADLLGRIMNLILYLLILRYLWDIQQKYPVGSLQNIFKAQERDLS